MVITRQMKILAGAGIIVGALGVAGIGGAFAAPSIDTTPPTGATATAVPKATQPGGNDRRPNGVKPFGPGPGQVRPGLEGVAIGRDLGSVATLLGMTPADLKTALSQG